MSFFEKSLNTLELPAVLTMLAAEAVSEPAKELALKLTPSIEEGEVRHRLSETTAAKSMMVVRGSPSFYGVKDVRSSLARADLGGSLKEARRIVEGWGGRLITSIAPNANSSRKMIIFLIRLRFTCERGILPSPTWE